MFPQAPAVPHRLTSLSKRPAPKVPNGPLWSPPFEFEGLLGARARAKGAPFEGVKAHAGAHVGRAGLRWAIEAVRRRMTRPCKPLMRMNNLSKGLRDPLKGKGMHGGPRYARA
jgi:hypothetical protein